MHSTRPDDNNWTDHIAPNSASMKPKDGIASSIGGVQPDREYQGVQNAHISRIDPSKERADTVVGNTRSYFIRLLQERIDLFSGLPLLQNPGGPGYINGAGYVNRVRTPKNACDFSYLIEREVMERKKVPNDEQLLFGLNHLGGSLLTMYAEWEKKHVSEVDREDFVLLFHKWITKLEMDMQDLEALHDPCNDDIPNVVKKFAVRLTRLGRHQVPRYYNEHRRSLTEARAEFPYALRFAKHLSKTVYEDTRYAIGQNSLLLMFSDRTTFKNISGNCVARSLAVICALEQINYLHADHWLGFQLYSNHMRPVAFDGETWRSLEGGGEVVSEEDGSQIITLAKYKSEISGSLVSPEENQSGYVSKYNWKHAKYMQCPPDIGYHGMPIPREEIVDGSVLVPHPPASDTKNNTTESPSESRYTQILDKLSYISRYFIKPTIPSMAISVKSSLVTSNGQHRFYGDLISLLVTFLSKKGVRRVMLLGQMIGSLLIAHKLNDRLEEFKMGEEKANSDEIIETDSSTEIKSDVAQLSNDKTKKSDTEIAKVVMEIIEEISSFLGQFLDDNMEAVDNDSALDTAEGEGEVAEKPQQYKDIPRTEIEKLEQVALRTLGSFDVIFDDVITMRDGSKKEDLFEFSTDHVDGGGRFNLDIHVPPAIDTIDDIFWRTIIDKVIMDNMEALSVQAGRPGLTPEEARNAFVEYKKFRRGKSDFLSEDVESTVINVSATLFSNLTITVYDLPPDASIPQIESAIESIGWSYDFGKAWQLNVNKKSGTEVEFSFGPYPAPMTPSGSPVVPKFGSARHNGLLFPKLDPTRLPPLSPSPEVKIGK